MAVGLFIVVLAAGLAVAVALLVYRHAMRLGLVAVPNARSSHTHPTASGGGVGIVAGGTLGAALAAWMAPWPAAFVGLLALAMAGIGFLDDRRPLPAPLRLAAHLVLVGAMVFAIPSDALLAGLGIPLPGLLVLLALVLAATYWVNIFNFMDGIDGLAASEAAFSFGAAALLAFASGASVESPLLWWCLAIAAACLGFLLLNWPPARLFMGDAGSIYLGFMLAFAALATIAAGWLNLWQWLILVALFLADATITIVRRLLRGEAIFRAHRLHAYQHLSRRWRSHRRVTGLFVAIDVVLLLPLAWAAGALPDAGPVAAVAAYVPLIAGLVWAGAGAPERPPA